MSGLRRCWLLAMLVCLAACGSASGASSGVTEEGTWRSSSSADSMLTISAPADWALTDDSGSTIVVATPGGGALEVEWIASGDKASLTQPQILEAMLTEATAEFEGKARAIEEVGRRVWMGEHYIWHEIQYIGSPTGECGGCRPAYYVDFVAYPDSGGLLRGRLTAPDAKPLEGEAETTLTKVIDSVTVRTPGTT